MSLYTAPNLKPSVSPSIVPILPHVAHDHKITSLEALERLKDGNARFARGLQSLESRKSVHHVRQLAEEGQFPFAIFVSCSDSRVPIEIVFDQGLGDLFSIRLAGNIAPSSAIASIEYAATNLGSPLVVVMGHTKCGAIKAAYDAVLGGGGGEKPSPHIADLVAQIAPSVRAATGGMGGHKHAQTDDGADSEQAALYRVTVENVRKTVADIQVSSPVIRNLCQARRLAITGAIYDVHTGKVTFDTTTASSLGD